MRTLADLKRAARTYGATVDVGDWPHSADVIAPSGRQWATSGTHSIPVVVGAHGRRAPPDWIDAAVTDALDRMCFGLHDCPPDCDCLSES